MTVATLHTFSQTYAQNVDAKVEKKFKKTDTNSENFISLKELTAFYEGKKS